MSKSCVLILRPAPAGLELVQALNSISVSTVYFPVMNIIPVPVEKVKAEKLISFADIIIFISPNAVEFGAQYLKSYTKKIAAIGAGTELALKNKNKLVHIVPQAFNSEGLLAHDFMQDVANKNIVIIRGEGGREKLMQELTARGATVNYLEVYRRDLPVEKITVEILQKINLILITSQESLDNLLKLTPEHLQKDLRSKKLLVSSDNLKIAAQVKGFAFFSSLLKNASQHEIISYFIQTEK